MSNPITSVTAASACAHERLADNSSYVDLNELKLSALRGLVRMFNPAAQMFCYRLNCTDNGLVPEGLSPRYTIMTLLGLHRAENAGLESPIKAQPVLDRLLTDTGWVDNCGDLGLLIWLCAETAPDRLREVFSRFDVLGALDHFADARVRRTMELAWFLTGLSITKQAQLSYIPDVTDLAAKTFRLVKQNQGKRGVFGHLGNPGGIAGWLRGNIGSFADQVYPIYGFSRFAQAFGSTEALESAKECTRMICAMQGPLGQWWWHYDSARGEVAGKYPVFSVHQHGMAPMALFAIADVAGLDFWDPIRKGLQWIARNELHRDLRVPEADIVWRCLKHPKAKSYSNRIRAAMRLAELDHGLELMTECRPYELGWLLYAFAGRPD